MKSNIIDKDNIGTTVVMINTDGAYRVCAPDINTYINKTIIITNIPDEYTTHEIEKIVNISSHLGYAKEIDFNLLV